MENKKLKRLMTDVAKGKISQKEVDNLIKSEKVAEIKPKQGKKTSKKQIVKKDELNAKEVK